MAIDQEKYAATLQRTIEQLLERLALPGTVTIAPEELGLRGNVETVDSALLIGWRGGTLAAFEYLVRILYLRALGDDAATALEIHVDVGGYKQRQADELAEFARKIAQAVSAKGAPEVLRPMNAFERRIVHMTLKEMDEIATESIGADPNRRIVVKPKA